MRRISWHLPSLDSRERADRLRAHLSVWLAGILADAAPSSDELVYTLPRARLRAVQHALAEHHAALSAVPPDEPIEHWSDDASGTRCCARMRRDDGWHRPSGRIIQKSVTPMRSFVAAPMRYGQLFLAGDAAHIVPPTGAKGMNLAASDVLVLARALKSYYETGSTEQLDEYSDVCLRRVWKAQRFSWWMTSLLHRSRRIAVRSPAATGRPRLRDQFVRRDDQSRRAVCRAAAGRLTDVRWARAAGLMARALMSLPSIEG